MKVIVIGAGIGGMTLGIALRRRGIDVTVMERREGFTDEGAGVVLGPNVMAALRALELDAAVVAKARPVEAMNITDLSGRILARSGYRVAELALPGMAVHRSRLHEVLREAFDGELRTSAAVTRLDFTKHPTVYLGDEAQGADLIVGADGIRSLLRKDLNPGFQTRYSGYTCWRFVTDEQWTDEVFEMWGPGKRVGVVPIGQGKTYVLLTLNAPHRAEAPFVDVAGFRQTWAEFGDPAARALGALTNLSQLLHNDLEDGIPPRWWSPGRVLLGDAAHAVTPNMGQGAGLAIEDAACLADLLARGGPTDAALARYEALRRPRATWIRDQSYTLGRIAQIESSWVRWFRDRAVSWAPASVNDAAMRRIVTDMPGVPIAR